MGSINLSDKQMVRSSIMTTLTTIVSLLAAISLTTATPTDPFILFARTTCSTPYGSGTCKATSSCTTSGFNIAGYCPGSASNQCCIEKSCTTSSESGQCLNTGNACSGKFVAGACPGPSDVQVYLSPCPELTFADPIDSAALQALLLLLRHLRHLLLAAILPRLISPLDRQLHSGSAHPRQPKRLLSGATRRPAVRYDLDLYQRRIRC